MKDTDNTPIAPWYRQPWLWFILAPIIAVVIYGTGFLYLSIVTHDGIVKDDYYKVARDHFVDKTKSAAAKSLALEAQLLLDNETGDLLLKYGSNEIQKPEFLKLSIIHPTHQKYDQNILLKKIPGRDAFTGNLKAFLKGKRYLILEDESRSWNLRAVALPPYDQNTIDMTPAH